MTTLENLIQSGNYTSTAEAHQAITTASVERRDDQQYTWAGVAQVAGPQAAEALRLALESNGMGWAVHQLGGSGLALSDPSVQQALLGLAQAGVPGCAELAAKGISLVTPWEAAGLAEAPTLAEVEAAWEVVANPPVPDAQSHEVLLTVNKQSDGTILAMARITPVGLKDGKVISRGQAQVITNGDLVQVVTPILEMLTNG